MSTILNGGKVPVDDTATMIVGAGRAVRTVTLRNVGASTVHLGNASVDTDWIPVEQDEARRFVTRGAIYGVCAAAASTDVSFDVVG